MIGMSEGNGHPFSFSAIINGYSDKGMAEAGWPVIYEYLRSKDSSEFGVEGLAVTHAWTQDPIVTEKLCRASNIPHSLDKLEDFIGNVDAIIIARDDYETHFSMAMPFLQAGLHVFVDKPLSISIEELKIFKPYLESGRLMSCSAMRYAKELDELRASVERWGKLKLVRGAILNSWEKYGIHLLDAIWSITHAVPLYVTSQEAGHTSIAITMNDGSLVQIDALGDCPKTFRIDAWGSRQVSSHEITDNFSMFRRMLWHFSRAIHNGQSAVDPEETITMMKILIAGRIAQQEKRQVAIDEITI
jgi:predicted dehydrogenase